MLRRPLMAVHQTPTTGRRQIGAQRERVRRGGASEKGVIVVDRKWHQWSRPLAVTEC